METFTLNSEYMIKCESKKTRNGFKHVASIYYNGTKIKSKTAQYLNRTWESYEFQSVLHRLIENYFPEPQSSKFIRVVDNQDKGPSILQLASRVAMMGEFFGTTPKEKNDWKKRMIATVPGISFPDDFDQLPEDVKEQRLNEVIKIAKGE
jgi:hypothetical protein